MRTIDPSTGATSGASTLGGLGAIGLRAGLVVALLAGGWMAIDRMLTRPGCDTIDCVTYEVELRDERPALPHLGRADLDERLVREPVAPGRIEGATHCAFHDRDGARAAWMRLDQPDRAVLEEYCHAQGIHLP